MVWIKITLILTRNEDEVLLIISSDKTNSASGLGCLQIVNQ